MKRRSPWSVWRAIVRTTVGPNELRASVIIMRGPLGWYSIAVAGPPAATLQAVFDQHSHAIIAEKARTLREAKSQADAWCRRFRRGLELVPCACETIQPAATS